MSCQIGAASVLPLLLSTAFGIPLKDSLRTAAHALSQESRDDLAAGADALSRLCSYTVYPTNKGYTDSTGVAVRTALFDIIHSVRYACDNHSMLKSLNLTLCLPHIL